MRKLEGNNRSKGGRTAEIFGIPLFSSSKKQLLRQIGQLLDSKSGNMLIYTPNPETVLEAESNLRLRQALLSADANVVDGVGVMWANRLMMAKGLERVRVAERITGVGLGEELVAMAAKKGGRVMLLGGGPGVANEAARRLEQRYAGAEIRGVAGYRQVSKPTSAEERRVRQLVGEWKPDVLLVAFGHGKQEPWLCEHRELGFLVGVGVGGSVDVWAGRVKRAPVYLQKLGLEWAWRLILQPWRWRRQLKLVRFVTRVVTS